MRKWCSLYNGRESLCTCANWVVGQVSYSFPLRGAHGMPKPSIKIHQFWKLRVWRMQMALNAIVHVSARYLNTMCTGAT